MRFDPSQHEEVNNEAFPTVTPGYYYCKVLEGEERTSRNGAEMLNLKLNIEEGEFEGQWLWTNVILGNSSQKAIDMGNKTLKRICTDNNITQAITDPQQLVLADCYVRVVHEMYEGEMRAKIKTFVSKDEYIQKTGTAPIAQPLQRTTTHQAAVNYSDDEPPF